MEFKEYELAGIETIARGVCVRDGKLLLCETADAIKVRAGAENFEQAFIRIVKGEIK